MLMYSVAGGVAFGIALGVGKIVFGFDLATVLIPLYLTRGCFNLLFIRRVC